MTQSKLSATSKDVTGSLRCPPHPNIPMSDWTLCDCPHCGNTLRIDASTADEWTQCPSCRRHARIPDLLERHLETSEAGISESAGRESGLAWAGASYRMPSRETDAGEHALSEDEDFASTYPDSRGLAEEETPAEAEELAYSEARASGAEGPDDGPWGGQEPDEPPYEYDFSELENVETTGEPSAKARKGRKRRFGLFGETPEWEIEDPRSRGRDLAGKRVIAAGVGIVIIGAIVLAIVMASSSGRTGGDASQLGGALSPILLPTEGENLSTEEAVRNLQLALQTRPRETLATIRPSIEAFLNASDWQEREKRVRDPERVRPLMEEYYRQKQDGPIPFLKVGDDEQSVDYRGNLLVVRVLMRDYSTKQIAIEYTGSEFLVDWESFVGHGEMPMERFREERPTRPVLMRASYAPAVPPYFNYAFTDEENLECHLLTFPDESYMFGYTTKFSPSSTRLRELRGNAASAMAVLKLRYPEDARVGDQVWIDEVVAEGWILHEATRTNTP